MSDNNAGNYKFGNDVAHIGLSTSRPPAPTMEEVENVLPKDFLPDHPFTDRLSSALDAWDVSKQLIKEHQRILDMVSSDFVHSLLLLDSAKEYITDESVRASVIAMTERFKDGIQHTKNVLSNS